MLFFIKWFADIFSINKKDNTLIGLSQLKETQETVKEIKKIKIKKEKEVKISDLIRGEINI